MPDFERASIVLGREFVHRGRPRTDAWHTRRVCASLPIIIVETLDAIAQDTRRSRSAVITDVLRAHPDIAAALTALKLASPKVEA